MRRDIPLTPSPYDRLLIRADFLSVAKGARSNQDAFGLQARRRAQDDHRAPRFGLTVTKKVAPHAVDRNRIRRRLREALRLGAALSGVAGHDYVIVGRRPVLTMPFTDLSVALATGLDIVTRRGARPRTDARLPRTRDTQA